MKGDGSVAGEVRFVGERNFSGIGTAVAVAALAATHFSPSIILITKLLL